LVESLPFCPEKRSSLLSEIEDLFVYLLGNHPFVVMKARRLSWCRAAVLRGNTTGDSVGKKKKIHSMTTDQKNASDLDRDNIIPVTLDDLSEEDRREFERGIEEEKAARLKQYFKTRSGAVKKVTAPNPPPTVKTKVINSNEEIAHLVDVSVASKYGSDMANTARTITQLASSFDKFKEQFETNLPHQVRSVVLQMNDVQCDKQPMSLENNSFNALPTHIHTTGASACLVQPQIALNNSQYGQNFAGSSAHNYLSSVVLLLLRLRFHKISVLITEALDLILICSNLIITL
jgi:hypothetical protein